MPFVLFAVSIISTPFAGLVSPITSTKGGDAFTRAAVVVVA